MGEARYETLGQLAYDRVPDQASKILLYAEFVDDGVISPSLFYELKSGELHYVECDNHIEEELFRLQGIFGRDVKALEFEVELQGESESFRARFTYTDKFDDTADTASRRDAVLQRCFGHTSAHYPSH